MEQWKLVGCLRPPSGPHPGSGLADLIPEDVDFDRIVVSQTVFDDATAAIAASRGAGEPHNAVLEAWTQADRPPRVLVLNPLLDGGLFWTREHVLFEADPRPDPASHRKVIFPLRRRPGLPEDEFYAYWLERHGPLVASVASTLGIRRYVQSHTAHADSLGAPYDGLAEVWVADDAIATGGSGGSGGEADADARREAGRSLLEDERRFIDLPRSTVFWTRERIVR